jgi:hypothetical protein
MNRLLKIWLLMFNNKEINYSIDLKREILVVVSRTLRSMKKNLTTRYSMTSTMKNMGTI